MHARKNMHNTEWCTYKTTLLFCKRNMFGDQGNTAAPLTAGYVIIRYEHKFVLVYARQAVTLEGSDVLILRTHKKMPKNFREHLNTTMCRKIPTTQTNIISNFVYTVQLSINF